ncbi:MAG: hypothetical protein AAF652_10705 [Cyanobacteria bacterium P01_C01_bin.72]
MKKTANLSVYKLLGYLLLGIGDYAVLNASTGKTQAIALPNVPNYKPRSKG